MPQLYQYVVEGLFNHFFSDTMSVYNVEDVEFFLMFANEQNTLKDVQTIHPDNQSGNLICFSKLKFHLDKILRKGWNDSKTDAKPMTFYKLEVNNF